jgi:predicted transcriptional regulator
MDMRFEDFGKGAKCQTCGGSGKVVDHVDIGKWIKGRRERASKTLREISVSLGTSVSYLSDLERGRRAWRKDLYDRVLNAIVEG